MSTMKFKGLVGFRPTSKVTPPARMGGPKALRKATIQPRKPAMAKVRGAVKNMRKKLSK